MSEQATGAGTGPAVSAPQYKVHPIADVWPAPTDDEFGALKASVRAVGVKEPVLMWKGPDGIANVLDGRSRIRCLEELICEGLTLSENGHKLEFKVRYFEGTEREALEYVEAVTQRRNMTSSQRAAVAVCSGLMNKLYRDKESGTTGGEKEDAGMLAERVAIKAGTNRQYVYDCSKLGVTYLDILLRIRDGLINIAKGKKIAERRDQGLPDEEPEAVDGETPPVGETPRPAKPKEVYDGMKNEVHEDHHAVFLVRDKVRLLRKELQICLAKAQEIAEGPGGFNMSWQNLKSDLNNVRRHLEDHQPHAVCPYCDGTGSVTDEATGEKKTDPKCDGKKYLDRVQWKEVPTEIKAIFEGTQLAAPAVLETVGAGAEAPAL